MTKYVDLSILTFDDMLYLCNFEYELRENTQASIFGIFSVYWQRYNQSYKKTTYEEEFTKLVVQRRDYHKNSAMSIILISISYSLTRVE